MMPSEFIEGLRNEVRAKQAENGVQEACTEVARDHVSIIEGAYIGHAGVVMMPIMLKRNESLHLRCGRHDGGHGADDPELDWHCIAAMARAHSLGINMTEPKRDQ